MWVERRSVAVSRGCDAAAGRRGEKKIRQFFAEVLNRVELSERKGAREGRTGVADAPRLDVPLDRVSTERGRAYEPFGLVQVSVLLDVAVVAVSVAAAAVILQLEVGDIFPR